MKTHLLSYLMAVVIHAAVFCGSGFIFHTPPAEMLGGGGLSVELVEGPPVGAGASPQAGQPLPPAKPITEMPLPESVAKQVQPNGTTAPEPNAEPPLPVTPTENAKPQSGNTNLLPDAATTMGRLGAIAGERSGSVEPGSAGTGRGTGGGGGGSGTGWVSPQYGDNPLPVYPIEARKLHQQGTVVLSVLVNAQGIVETLAVKQSSGHVLLDQAAMRGVKRWRFRPATVAGIPVSTQIEQPIQFTLENRP
jgi:protein TonB